MRLELCAERTTQSAEPHKLSPDKMAKFPEADARMFRNMYICMKCNARNRVDARKVRLGKAKCRECGHKRLRQKKKGSK